MATTHRINEKDLERAVKRLNELSGTPVNTYSHDANGYNVRNVGNFSIHMAYGGYKLIQEVESGGCRQISTGGYEPKREIFNQLQALINIALAQSDKE